VGGIENVRWDELDRIKRNQDRGVMHERMIYITKACAAKTNASRVPETLNRPSAPLVPVGLRAVADPPMVPVPVASPVTVAVPVAVATAGAVETVMPLIVVGAAPVVAPVEVML